MHLFGEDEEKSPTRLSYHISLNTETIFTVNVVWVESTDANSFCRSIHENIPFPVFYLYIAVEGDGSRL